MTKYFRGLSMACSMLVLCIWKAVDSAENFLSSIAVFPISFPPNVLPPSFPKPQECLSGLRSWVDTNISAFSCLSLALVGVLTKPDRGRLVSQHSVLQLEYSISSWLWVPGRSHFPTSVILKARYPISLPCGCLVDKHAGPLCYQLQ